MNMKNIIYECIICKKFQDTGLKDCKRCFLDMAIIKNERVNKITTKKIENYLNHIK
jgi:hypothetical protein